jgi:tRNA(fMet)-specific endonuclease VapC
VKILDTDTCVEILRGNDRVIQRREDTEDSVGTTWITAAELFYGAAKSKNPVGNRAAVEEFLATLPILGLDLTSSQFFGGLKASLETQGRRLADADLWIGAIARAHRAAVVTGNSRHFSRIEGVQLENWIA